MFKTIKVKDIIDEDYTNYKKPSMFIATSQCTFKCEKEDSNVQCHNCDLVKQKTIELTFSEIIERYLKNELTSAIVFGGLEPLDEPHVIIAFIQELRKTYNCNDDIVIYTGYTEQEVEAERFVDANLLDILKNLHLLGNNNLIIKYGRFRSTNNFIYDSILGVNLASSNQYSKCY